MSFELSGCGIDSCCSLVATTQTLDIAPVSSKQFTDIQATTEFTFTLNHICDII